MKEFICPGCGVVVLEDIATAQDPLTGQRECVFCAPYDPAREDVALLFLDDAQEAELGRKRSPKMGATRRPEPPRRPTNVVIYPDQGAAAIALAEFAKEMFDLLYEGAKFGSPNQIVRDGAKEILDNASLLIKAKLIESGRRETPFILAKEETDKVLGLLELLHTRYMQAHRKLLEISRDKEEDRKRSYTMFWHIGSLVRTGELAKTVSPWVTGKEAPRF